MNAHELRGTWLYLEFHQLQLQHWMQQRPNCEQPLLIVCSDHNKVVQANPSARALGIHPGLALSDAWLLADALDYAYWQPEVEQRLLQQLAARLYTAFADLSLDTEANGLWVQLTTQQRLHAQQQTVADKVSKLLADTEYRASFSSNPLLAKLGIDDRAEALLQACQGYPLRVCGLADDMHHKLSSMGLDTIDKLLQIPVPILGKKLGQPIVDFILQLKGQLKPRLLIYQPREMIYLHRQLHAEVHVWSGLRFVAKSLLQDLEQHLRQSQQAVTRIYLVLFTRDFQGNPAQMPYKSNAFATFPLGVECVEIGFARAVYRLADTYSVLQLKLENRRFKAPIVDIGLYVEQTEAFTAQPMRLDQSKAGEHQLATLLNRLQSRLGADKVQTIHQHTGWLPEFQQSLQPVSDQDIGLSTAHDSTQSYLDWRPPWLLSPKPIDIRGWRIQGQPQRIQPPWWLPDQSGAADRDYLIAQDKVGRWGWVYFQHDAKAQASPQQDPGQWFLHGWLS